MRRKRRRHAAKARNEDLFNKKIKALVDRSKEADITDSSSSDSSFLSDDGARDNYAGSYNLCRGSDSTFEVDDTSLSYQDASDSYHHDFDQFENRPEANNSSLSANTNIDECSLPGTSMDSVLCRTVEQPDVNDSQHDTTEQFDNENMLESIHSNLSTNTNLDKCSFSGTSIDNVPSRNMEIPTGLDSTDGSDDSCSPTEDYPPLYVTDFLQDETMVEFSDSDPIGSEFEVRGDDILVSDSDDSGLDEDNDSDSILEWGGIIDTAEEQSNETCDSLWSSFPQSSVNSSSNCGDNSQLSSPSLPQDLAHWAIEESITHVAIDKLLAILNRHKRHGHESELPKSAKTLLKTPRSTKTLIKEFCGGLYWYNGISAGLKSRLTSGELHKLQGKNIAIDIFVDGISPYKSVKLHLCAIVGCIVKHPKPFVIALWCGSIKEPNSVHDFFADFISEAKTMMESGFVTDTGIFPFVIKKYIADAMARAWFLQRKPPQAYFCCEKCTLKGERVSMRIVFNPAEKGILRTDESLAHQDQKEHHDGVTPLLELGVKLKSQVPIEPMHNVYLGSFRRFFSMLLSTKRVSKAKLSNKVIEDLSTYLASLKPYYPSDFNRKPRPLLEWKLYKASEYHRLGLYDAFLILETLTDKKIRNVHRLLACAIRILSDPDLVLFYRRDADLLLKHFVKASTKLFGGLFNVFNIHCLTHLADETARHGTLNDFSAWKYESYLGNLKHMLRAPGRSLQQIVCRYLEKNSFPRLAEKESEDVILSQPHSSGPTLDITHKQFKYMGFGPLGEFRVSSANNVCFVSKSNEVCVVRNITRSTKGEISLLCDVFQESEHFFTYPFPSKLLCISKVKKFGGLKSYCISDIRRKAVLLPVNKKDVEKTPSSDWMNDVECLCLPMMHHRDDPVIRSLGPKSK